MQKINVLFRKQYTDRIGMIYNEVHRGSEWVLHGEGVATVKFDGSCCLIRDGKLYKRFDRKLSKHASQLRKKGQQGPWKLEDFKDCPEGWEPCEKDPNQYTGHWPGWLPVGNGPEDQYHREAFENGHHFGDGTYELVGPKVQRNLYKLARHELWRHGSEEVNVPRNFEGVREWLSEHSLEGLVFHHPDGRKAKIRRKDFGLSWGFISRPATPRKDPG